MTTEVRKVRLSVDPGVEFAIAVWEDRTWNEVVRPRHVYMSTERKGDWLETMSWYVCELRFLLKSWVIGDIYCEMPAHFESKGGIVTLQSGALVKLSIATGMLLGGLQVFTPSAKLHLIPVNNWKGQLSKALVQWRIQKLLHVDATTYKSHQWDAVGIGLFAKGVF